MKYRPKRRNTGFVLFSSELYQRNFLTLV